jgi:hypothetical protein
MSSNHILQITAQLPCTKKQQLYCTNLDSNSSTLNIQCETVSLLKILIEVYKFITNSWYSVTSLLPIFEHIKMSGTMMHSVCSSQG